MLHMCDIVKYFLATIALTS
jgi:hypothetical protein